MLLRYSVRLIPVSSGSLQYVVVIVEASSENEAIEEAYDCLAAPDQYLLDKVEVLGPPRN